MHYFISLYPRHFLECQAARDYLLYMVTRYVHKPALLGGKSEKSIHIKSIVTIKRIDYSHSESFIVTNFLKRWAFLWKLIGHSHKFVELKFFCQTICESQTPWNLILNIGIRESVYHKTRQQESILYTFLPRPDLHKTFLLYLCKYSRTS